MARRKSEGPSASWYKAMDEFYAKKHLTEALKDCDDKMIEVIKHRMKEFFIFSCEVYELYGWVGLEVLIEDFISEQSQFELKRKRMYSTNVKQWNKIRKIILERDNFTCTYCGKKGGILEIDHIIPFSKFGSDELDNLTTACIRCNRKKKDKDVNVFIIEM